MSRALIAGNWKMNLNRAQSVALAKELGAKAGEHAGVTLLVCPPAVYLTSVAEALAGSPVELGAQNVYFEAAGAFTGELSTSMLQDVGCTYVILGHSERRHVLGQTDAEICKKTHASLAAGLTPIVCVGELLAQRQETAIYPAKHFVTTQERLELAVKDIEVELEERLKDLRDCVISTTRD